MQRQPLVASQRDRIAAGLPFVESLARRVASSMPHSIELGDLVQDGMLGLIDAAFRFDEARGIKFETFAERRVRGAMIDALRRDAWPRGVRRQRRELEAAREELRRELGAEPSLADLAARVGSDEKRLGRTDRPHQHHRIDVAARRPARTSTKLDAAGGARAVRSRRARRAPTRSSRRATACRAAIASLPPRERKVIGLYYYGEATMKQIGAEIGVNESRVSQLHARAIQRLRKALGADCSMEEAARALRPAILSFQQTMTRVKMAQSGRATKRGRMFRRSSFLQRQSRRRRRSAVAVARDAARARPLGRPTQRWAVDLGLWALGWTLASTIYTLPQAESPARSLKPKASA